MKNNGTSAGIKEASASKHVKLQNQAESTNTTVESDGAKAPSILAAASQLSDQRSMPSEALGLSNNLVIEAPVNRKKQKRRIKEAAKKAAERSASVCLSRILA